MCHRCGLRLVCLGMSVCYLCMMSSHHVDGMAPTAYETPHEMARPNLSYSQNIVASTNTSATIGFPTVVKL